MSSSELAGHAEQEVAVIGMAGRFSGARNLEEFWHNLREGLESIRFFSDEELLAAGVDPKLLRDPSYVKAGGVLDGVELFDASFFGYSPREAEILDPQHRIFLECAWEALENAGHRPESHGGLIGLYAGVSASGYLLFHLLGNREVLDRVGPTAVALGNDKDYLATRVSYKLGLRGPGVTVQTACSTSLVAVHLACQSLLNAECDMALAGGVSVQLPQTAGYRYEKQGLLSPDGRCRTFDAGAQGTVTGRGVGVVVLKRLVDALRDGDPIRAIIKGSGINNDGAARVGYTAPSVEGQSEIIAEVLAIADVDPETITYVEAHGTGTELGDPIEIEALSRVFRESTDKRGFCALGSVKTNIGHTDAAAGVAGLIKAVLALENRAIPPSLHFERPNPKIDFAASPFYVNTVLQPWETGATPRRAGVSSFGLGGTNAHVILEEAPARPPSGESRPWQLLLLSARTATALEQVTADLAEYLHRHPDVDLADVAFTRQLGRRAFDHRRILVCRDVRQAASTLAAGDSKDVLTRHREAGDRPLAFLFSGLGGQYVGMAGELYRDEPVFREHLDRCCDLLAPSLGTDLRRVLYPDGVAGLGGGEEGGKEPAARPAVDLRRLLAGQGPAGEASRRLSRTLFAHAALFAVQYAMAHQWLSWGIRPQAMIGYSLGEYVAACLAEVLSLEDALTLVVERARLAESLPTGAMVAVPLSPEAAAGYLGPDLSCAAVNGPEICVLAGPEEAVAALEVRLAREGLACRRLQALQAFHSRQMEPIAGTFARVVRRVALRAPRIPYISTVTGTWISAAEATDPEYWVRHLCGPVRFAAGVQELWRAPNRVLLELGPGQGLLSLALQSRPSEAGRPSTALPSLRQEEDRVPDLAFLLCSLGQLWLAGVEVDWETFQAKERRHRLPLPTYPFERQRFWIDRAEAPRESQGRSVFAGKGEEIAAWFHQPAWRSVARPAGAGHEAEGGWLVFVGDGCLDRVIAERLRQAGRRLTTVQAGESFGHPEEGRYRLRPQAPEDYRRLLRELCASGDRPAVVLHLWSLAAVPDTGPGEAVFAAAQMQGYYSLLFLVQALVAEAGERALRIAVVADGLADVSGEERVTPEKAPLIGLAKVIPQEHPHISCRCIDVRPAREERDAVRLADAVLAEIGSGDGERLVACRGSRRWVQTFESLRLEHGAPARRRLRQRGVYMIFGGLGGIGLRVAEYLLQTAAGRLVLVSRAPLPSRETWDEEARRYPPDHPVPRRIARLRGLEAQGAEMLLASADLAEEEQVRGVVAEALGRFGEIHGVFHCAGVTRGPSLSPLLSLGVDESEAQFRAKAYGLYVLERALAGIDLDFCFFFSSAAAVLGGLGHGAYAAASLFMDAFTVSRNATGKMSWLTADWDPWPGETETGPTLQSSVAQYIMTPAEAIEALHRALCLGPEHLVVATGDLEGRLDVWVRGAGTVARRAPRAVPTPFVAPRNETERIIAGLWREHLGIEEVGVHDNFFQLGGHSLLGMRLRTRLEEIFQVDLPMAVILQAPTVAEAAVAIEVALIEMLATMDTGAGVTLGVDAPPGEGREQVV